MGRSDFLRSIKTNEAKDWLDAVRLAGMFSADYVFRGHRSDEWLLETKLQRSNSTDPVADERKLLDWFRRRAGVYLGCQAPADSDILAWLSLMQHYGAPTRLLDVTRSPYVALFFAVENATPNDTAVLLAFNVPVLQDAAIEQLAVALKDGDEARRLAIDRQDELVNSLVGGLVVDAVMPVEPWRFDARQTAQQAMFLCPMNLAGGIEESLLARDVQQSDLGVEAVLIPPAARVGAMSDLQRLNLTPSALFPGLDGFARSLNMLISAPATERSALDKMVTGPAETEEFAQQERSFKDRDGYRWTARSVGMGHGVGAGHLPRITAWQVRFSRADIPTEPERVAWVHSPDLAKITDEDLRQALYSAIRRGPRRRSE